MSGPPRYSIAPHAYFGNIKVNDRTNALACGQDAKSALKLLRELRPGVRLHRTQRKLLEAFAGERVVPSSPRPEDEIERI